MRRRVEFSLTMPNVGSWNGKWSGEGRHYAIVRSLSDADLIRLGIAGGKSPSWYYGWSDRWGASVKARLMSKGERLKKSAGFCGYDWMVANIVRWGTPKCQCEWTPDRNSGTPGWEGQWERCRYCDTRRQVATPNPPPECEVMNLLRPVEARPS